MGEEMNAAGMGLAPADDTAADDTAAAAKGTTEEIKADDKVEDTEAVKAPVKKETKKETEVQARDYSEPKKEKDLKLDDDMDPEDKERIQKMIDVESVERDKIIQRQGNEIAVNRFIVDNPEFQEHKSDIERHVQHPAYTHVPIEMIAKSLAFDNARAMGAQGERDAQAKAAATKSPGTGKKKAVAGTSIADMTNEAFEARIAKEKRGY